MERIWLKHYPEGVPADIDVSVYPSLVGLLEENRLMDGGYGIRSARVLRSSGFQGAAGAAAFGAAPFAAAASA